MRRDHQKMDKVLQEKEKITKISSTLSPTQYAEALKEVDKRRISRKRKNL